MQKRTENIKNMETNFTTSTKNSTSNDNSKEKKEIFNKSKWPSLKKNTKSKSDKKNNSNKNNSNKNKTTSPRIQLNISNNSTSNKSENNTVKSIKSKLDKRPKEQKITDSDMFLISRNVIPAKLLKIVKVKESLKRGDALTVSDALEEFDVDSRLYYKYKPLILPFYEATTEKIFTLVFSVEQEGNVLTKIVTMISKHFGEIITLNKGFPVNKISTISVSFDTTNLDIDFDVLLSKLEMLNGVRSMEIMGRIHSTKLSKPEKLNKSSKQPEPVKNDGFVEIDEFKKSDGFIKISESKEFNDVNKPNEVSKVNAVNGTDNNDSSNNFNSNFKGNNRYKRNKKFNKPFNKNKKFNNNNHSKNAVKSNVPK